MLAFDSASIEEWLRTQPGGSLAPEPGLGEDALPAVLLGLDRLGGRLSAVCRDDPGRLDAALHNRPTQAIFRAIAHHLSLGRRLRMVAWLVEVGLLGEREILAALFDPAGEPAGAGAALWADIQRHHRAGLIETIFAPDRRARVRTACERGRS